MNMLTTNSCPFNVSSVHLVYSQPKHVLEVITKDSVQGLAYCYLIAVLATLTLVLEECDSFIGVFFFFGL